jgi:hypothetical protein
MTPATAWIKALRTYIEGLQDWVSGILEWHRMTARYDEATLKQRKLGTYTLQRNSDSKAQRELISKLSLRVS